MSDQVNMRFPTIRDMNEHGMVRLYDTKSKTVRSFPMVDAREICAAGRYTAEIPFGKSDAGLPKAEEKFMALGVKKLEMYAEQAGIAYVGMSADRIISSLVAVGFDPDNFSEESVVVDNSETASESSD